MIDFTRQQVGRTLLNLGLGFLNGEHFVCCFVIVALIGFQLDAYHRISRPHRP